MVQLTTAMEAPAQTGPMTSGTVDGALARLRAQVEKATGLCVREIVELPAGLGLRRFYRVRTTGEPASLIARLETPEDPAGRPAGVPPEPPLEPIRALLESAGLPVPRRVGSVLGDDLDLLEDLGSATLDAAGRGEPGRCAALYEQVVDRLPALQALAPVAGVAAFERRLDAPLFAHKAGLVVEWSLPEALGRAATRAEGEAVSQAFGWIANLALEAPARLAHRDLHSRNLLVQGGRVRWIDLQGAFLAPPEYDLVCLLRDSYVTLPELLVDQLLERVRPALPDAPTPEDFRRRFDLLTLTRKGKDHARFVYSAATRGEASQRAYLPATTRALHRAARACAGLAPELARLAELLLALPEGDGVSP